MSQFTRLYATARYCDSLQLDACASAAGCIVDAATRRCEVANHAQPLQLDQAGVDELRELIKSYESVRAEVSDVIAEKEAIEKEAAALKCALKKAGRAYEEVAGATLALPSPPPPPSPHTPPPPPPPLQPAPVPNLETVLNALYTDLGVVRALPPDRPLIPDDVLDAVDSIRTDATQYLKEKGTTFLSGFDKPDWLKTREERTETKPPAQILEALRAVNRYAVIKEFNPTDDLITYLNAILDYDATSVVGYKRYDVAFQNQSVSVPCFEFTPQRLFYGRAVQGALDQIARVSWPNDLLTLNERENKRRLQPIYDQIRRYFNEEGGRFNRVKNISDIIVNDLIQYVMPVVQPVPAMTFVVMPFARPPPSLSCAQIQDALAPDGVVSVRSVCTNKSGCDASIDGQCREGSFAKESETPPNRPARPSFLSGISARPKVEGGAPGKQQAVKPFTLMVKSADSGSDPVPLTVLKMESVDEFRRKFTSAQFCGVDVGGSGISGVVNLYNQLRPLTLVNFLLILRTQTTDADFGARADSLLRDNVYAMMGKSSANEGDFTDAVRGDWYAQSSTYLSDAFGNDAPEINLFKNAVDKRNLESAPSATQLQNSFCQLDKQVQDYLQLRNVVTKDGGKVALTTEFDKIDVAKQTGMDPLQWYPPLAVQPVKDAYTEGGVTSAQAAYKALTSAQKTEYRQKLEIAEKSAKDLHNKKTKPFLIQLETALAAFNRCTAPPYSKHLNKASPFCTTEFPRLTKLADGIQCVQASTVGKLNVPSGLAGFPFGRRPPPVE